MTGEGCVPTAGPFTHLEDEYLRDNPFLSDLAAAEHLGRHQQAVHVRRRQLGLPTGLEHVLLLDRHSSSIHVPVAAVRKAIENGRLPKFLTADDVAILRRTLTGFPGHENAVEWLRRALAYVRLTVPNDRRR